jgi:hypothetical protein
VYFIDTSATETAGCIDLQNYQISSFEPNKSYLLYHLFATSATSVTYQLYVGDNFVPATNATWVCVQVHQGNLHMEVDPSAAPLGQIHFGGKDGLPPAILQVTLDNSTVTQDYQFSAVSVDVQCQPPDICRPQNGACALVSKFPEAGLSSMVAGRNAPLGGPISRSGRAIAIGSFVRSVERGARSTQAGPIRWCVFLPCLFRLPLRGLRRD